MIPIPLAMSDSPEPFTVTALLQRSEALAGAPGLSAAAAKIFDYAQYLLDDDDKLTRTGALNSDARELLRKRILELAAETEIGGEEP